MGTERPAPGSNAAIDAGCICPVLDNAHGAGFPVRGETSWWITEGCPLHAASASDTTLEAAGQLNILGAE